MIRYDAIVIGGGILGCFTARNLRRWKISTLLLEQEQDVCTGITRANSAIVYAGCDTKPGSRKSEMTVRGNAGYETLCRELGVPFSRCGSLLVAYDDAAEQTLHRKLENGRKNGVPGLKLLSGAQARAMEPMLKEGVKAALYAPTTGTVNPWQLGIAAYENALHNGAEAVLGARVLQIRRAEQDYEVITAARVYRCRMVFNCAGLEADRVREMLFSPSIRLRLDGTEYLVFDRLAPKPGRVIFHETEGGKGITAVPCVEGNLLISGGRSPLHTPFATTRQGLRTLHTQVRELLAQADTRQVIRSFAAVRPNPCTQMGENLPDFCIDRPEPGFCSLIGIKTPGLTCANELGMELAQTAAQYLQAPENPEFDPHRPPIRATDHEIVCRCEQITKGQILEAIRRGAATPEGVKRRVGTSMGRCQGSRCTLAIEKLLEEYRNGTL